MTYVISDVHDRWDLFCEMLEKIHFSTEDKLYFLGDAIDRGNGDGIKILRFIKDAPNIDMILGNHEHMMLTALLSDDLSKLNRWMRNGGKNTLESFLRLLNDEQQDLLCWLKECPISRQVEIGDNTFFLVHGWPRKTVEESVWGRPPKDVANPIPEKTLIVGHTPVFHLYKSEFEDDDLQIFYGKGFIDIDCGCGHLWATGCLACLRLNDMTEFYVK